ncbi:drug/metabolite transporter (DMT)-like permease [Chryseomicrobium aureum]|uniref:EamA family transporter n=1 Tax=Chryseomicrobium aureum TaxID=1441723 RepID=UPI00195AAA7E|nr:drug/metabolite transporter (DMT)-like permease [Chryseomicrobium aureum]
MITVMDLLQLPVTEKFSVVAGGNGLNRTIQGIEILDFEFKEALYSLVYLAVFSTAIAYLFQNMAHQYTTATKAAIILSTEAVFSMLLSVLFLHEVLTGRMLMGAALILVAILLAEVKPRFHKKMLRNSRS